MIRIEDDILHLKQLGLLDGLLYDRTTKHNIIWATDAHASLGPAFARDKEIHVNQITGDYSGVIRTRAAKAYGQQSDRTRQHGEVFTPLWICKMMNDYADETWFDCSDAFEKNGKPTKRVKFPKKRNGRSMWIPEGWRLPAGRQKAAAEKAAAKKAAGVDCLRKKDDREAAYIERCFLK